MESQNQEIVASGSPAEVPNDPGKMFIGGLSWQTSPGEEDDKDTNFGKFYWKISTSCYRLRIWR